MTPTNTRLGKTVFVGGIPNVNTSVLRTVLQQFGDVGTIRIEEPDDRSCSGGGRYALVEMPNSTLVSALNSATCPEIYGRKLALSSAQNEALLQTPTFKTFLRFLGDRTFTATPKLFDKLTELSQNGHVWISRLDDSGVNRFKKVFEHLVPGNNVLTVGPLEGNLEWHLAQMAPRSLMMIEGYHPNVIKCEVLTMAFPEYPMRIQEGEVLSCPIAGKYDLLVCCGLLYHLLEPHLLLQKFKELNPKWVVLTTQLATLQGHPSALNYKLKNETTVILDGKSYKGRLFPDKRSTHAEYRTGVDQRDSFWFYESELQRIVADLGFKPKTWHVQDLGEKGLILGAVLVC